MTKIRIGLAGCGFVSELHMHAYKRVYGVNVEVKAVAARGDHVVEFARRHHIPTVYRSFGDLIADREIDVVDICTPPNLHASMIVEAMQAGKHVICEKPFSGYFGRDGDQAPIGKHVPKARMYQHVIEEMQTTRAAIERTGKLFMYAEDWIYAPAVTKTVEMLKATKDKILFMKGEESHSGSHAAHAAQWAMTGGGSLIRMGCHPLSAVLYLKQVEAKARGETIRVASVTCDVGNVAACLKPEERTVIKANPVDVEDWGMLTVDLLRRHQGDGVFRRHDSGRRAQPDRNPHVERRALRQHHAEHAHDDVTRPARKNSPTSTLPKRSIARPAGNMSASRKNGRAATCRKSRISWNASRPAGSRCPISRSPSRPSRSTTPAIGPPKRAVASRCEVCLHLARLRGEVGSHRRNPGEGVQVYR